MRPLPEHGKCFVCGTENPHSIGIQWFLKDDGSIFGQVTLTESQQGPPGFAHGGASAALLDEAMGGAAWQSGLMLAAVNLNVNFVRPVPLGAELTITGELVEQSGKTVRVRGAIRLPDGEVAVESKGIFVEAKNLFKKFAEQHKESKL